MLANPLRKLAKWQGGFGDSSQRQQGHRNVAHRELAGLLRSFLPSYPCQHLPKWHPIERAKERMRAELGARQSWRGQTAQKTRQRARLGEQVRVFAAQLGDAITQCRIDRRKGTRRNGGRLVPVPAPRAM